MSTDPGNAKDLVRELAHCFGINPAEMGLSVRMFANPHQSVCTDYPSKETIHAILSEDPAEALYKTITVDGQLCSSLKCASKAHDRTSIKRMLRHPNFDEKYVSTELLSKVFLQELIQLPVGEKQKALMLKGIQLNLLLGNVRLLRDIIAEYRKNYSEAEEQKELQQAILDILQNYNNLDGAVFRGTADYTPVIEICNSLSEKQQQTIQIPIVNLKLLTALSREEPNDVAQSLNKTELKQQLTYALLNHQHQLLQVLLKQKSQLENPQTLFSEEILQVIDVTSMRQLLQAEIPVNPEGLGILSARNERHLFEPYLNIMLIQTGQALESSKLFETIGNLRRIDILLALGEKMTF